MKNNPRLIAKWDTCDNLENHRLRWLDDIDELCEALEESDDEDLVALVPRIKRLIDRCGHIWYRTQAKLMIYERNRRQLADEELTEIVAAIPPRFIKWRGHGRALEILKKSRHWKAINSYIEKYADDSYSDLDSQTDWDDMVEALSQAMAELNKEDAEWYVTGEGMGWQSRSGHKRFSADDGQAFLNGVLPKTDCTFTISWDDDEHTAIKIVNSHHDAMGEVYICRPVRHIPITFVPTFHLQGLADVMENKSAWAPALGLPQEGCAATCNANHDGYLVRLRVNWEGGYLKTVVEVFGENGDEPLEYVPLRHLDLEQKGDEEFMRAEIDTGHEYIFDVKILDRDCAPDPALSAT